MCVYIYIYMYIYIYIHVYVYTLSYDMISYIVCFIVCLCCEARRLGRPGARRPRTARKRGRRAGEPPEAIIM